MHIINCFYQEHIIAGVVKENNGNIVVITKEGSDIRGGTGVVNLCFIFIFHEIGIWICDEISE